MQTSSQAVFMLHCMAKNPEAQEKLYKEIQTVLGERTQPTVEDLREMPYLKGCMMECLRYLLDTANRNKINGCRVGGVCNGWIQRYQGFGSS